MKIVILTAGTGSFYCGNCMRDNALAQGLRKLGHDAVLVPMYLPLMLDEPAATESAPVFYGGINVYLQQKLSIFRKTPRFVDRLFDSPAALRAAAGRAGMTTPDELGDMTLSMARGEEGNQVKELARLTEWLQGQLPDVVCLSNAMLLGLAREIRRQTGAAVVNTLQGEDSFLDCLPEPFRTQVWETLAERANEVEAHIAPSRTYGEALAARLRIPPDRWHVVYNGIDVDGYAPGGAPPPAPTIGFLSRMCPPKGLHLLIDAFIMLRRDGAPGWPASGSLRLCVAGSVTAADETYVAQQRKRVEDAGLAESVEWLPNLDRAQKIRFLQGLSVLSVPATYGEAFGLYVIESLAAGVPVVQPRNGAFPELLELTGGGTLFEPGDSGSLAEALAALLRTPERAQEMGIHGRKVVEERFTAESMARGALKVFESAAVRRLAVAV